jgi:hypothetical protein
MIIKLFAILVLEYVRKCAGILVAISNCIEHLWYEIPPLDTSETKNTFTEK